ncbi:hypothetical protein NYO91_09600 [Arhodomonas aquaeolei]|uniref:hypothetical protein n=1 Tax=Arhodomonas aquaeolei TaxID=2369 RepID=UPI002168C4A0|nr:hypothetical protein [Arhodomonas aquaeolei]MCS4504329.1 hypothetical protein [Arhodomonas aquaeolei]
MSSTAIAAQRAHQRRIVDQLAEHGPPAPADAVIETHLSWVILAGDRALKLKKALHYPWLDYASLAARRHQCREEVRLNRRLAPAVYLGVAAVSATDGGHLVLDGDGPPLAYLVRMQRLPERDCLGQRLGTGGVTPAEVDTLADTLSGFYAARTPFTPPPHAWLEAMRGHIDADSTALGVSRYGLDRALIRRVARDVHGLLDDRADEIGGRLRDGRVVEGHGDLRAEHVYFTPGPTVIDCLEFDRGLRIVDPADELAFLALECHRLGAEWIGPRPLRRYTEVCGDAPGDRLLAAYTGRRALLWAKLAVWHLDRDPARDREKWLERAGTYLTLARERILG